MALNLPPSSDIAQAYQQIWPEVSYPAAGSTFPEWIYYKFVAAIATGFIPAHELVALQAVNRASTY